jgi:hypothetical protein
MICLKVIIAGGKHFVPSINADNWVTRILKNMQEDFGPITIISGGARGADKFGELKAKELKLQCLVFPAQWNVYGKVAGFKRNEEMAQIANVCILFPGGNGTADMLKRAITHKLIIYQYKESNANENNSR